MTSEHSANTSTIDTAALIELVRSVYNSAADPTAFIPLHAPTLTDADRDAVADAVTSTFVSSVGPQVAAFESALAAYTGVAHVFGTVNGTSALHLALHTLGVAPGDEVITQSVTFVATCNAIRYCGADPVFVDIERATLGMSPDSLLEFLETHAERRDDGLCWNKTTGRVIRACVPMHCNGHPLRVDAVAAVCARWGLVLIEDAAESLGSVYHGRHTGRFGRVGVLSFNGNKIITTGGGGAVLTDDAELAARLRHLGTTAKRAHAYLFEHDAVGFNYRLPALNAALGCAQLARLPEYVDRKRGLAARYRSWCAERGIPFIDEPAGACSNFWFNAILARDRAERDRVLAETNAHGVMTRPLWTPLHTLPMYRDCLRGPLPCTDFLESRLINLPSSVPPGGC